MRPKKNVLLICPNEVTASHLTITMRDIWGYRVVILDDISDAEKVLSALCFDLVLLMPTRDKRDHAGFCEAAKTIKAIQDEIGFQTAIFDRQKVLDGAMAEGVNRIAAEVMGLDVLRNGMIVALARKRGPKKRNRVELRRAA